MVKMPDHSRYAGQPVDLSSRRSIEVALRDTQNPAIGSHTTHVTVDYFYHEGQFWKAIIPLDGVAQVYGQAFNFSPPKTRPGEHGPEIILDRHGVPKRKIPMLNHVQSRFRMKADYHVQLFPRDAEEWGPATHRVGDFVYSVEAIGPAGIKFNLRDGLAGNLLSAHRFLSTEEMVFERIVVQNQYLFQSPPLPLDEGVKRSLLVNSLLRGHRAGMNESYFLFRFWGTNNCTSNPFQILDEVAEYSWTQRLGSLLYRLPLKPRLYLRLRGMDPDPRSSTLVREEFEEFIQAEATQQRRREYVRQRSAARRTTSD